MSAVAEAKVLRRRRPPCERTGPDAFALRLSAEEHEVLVRLLGDLDAMLDEADLDDLASERTTDGRSTPLRRLFPPAFTDYTGADAERDAEYRRLMYSELVASRRAALAAVLNVIDPDRDGDDDGTGSGGGVRRFGADIVLDTAQITAFMQGLNSLRLVLGAILGIVDDDAATDADDRLGDTPEYALFGWSGWMLEWVVQALSGNSGSPFMPSGPEP